MNALITQIEQTARVVPRGTDALERHLAKLRRTFPAGVRELVASRAEAHPHTCRALARRTTPEAFFRTWCDVGLPPEALDGAVDEALDLLAGFARNEATFQSRVRTARARQAAGKVLRENDLWALADAKDPIEVRFGWLIDSTADLDPAAGNASDGVNSASENGGSRADTEAGSRAHANGGGQPGSGTRQQQSGLPTTDTTKESAPFGSINFENVPTTDSLFDDRRLAGAAGGAPPNELSGPLIDSSSKRRVFKEARP